MKPIRILISSVQKELELERAAVAGLSSTDPPRIPTLPRP